jgi:hypothetical protein
MVELLSINCVCCYFRSIVSVVTFVDQLCCSFSSFFLSKWILARMDKSFHFSQMLPFKLEM